MGYPKHSHEFATVTHQTQAPNKNTGAVREFVSWSQCQTCGKAEDERPAEAPPVKATVYKGDAPS